MNQSSLAFVKDQLPRTWPIFFARHGNLTPIQAAAIPVVLDGVNTLILSATASGKTEAAIAPLLERYLANKQRTQRKSILTILFICPTRALTRDLYERLAPPLSELNISLAMKTGDTPAVSSHAPPTVLLTTPESTDSLLTRSPRIFCELRSIVLDEIHLFDNSPRGDHLLCLLQRIEHIRTYHYARRGKEAPPLLRVALSATVPDPEGLAARYLTRRGGKTSQAESSSSSPSAATAKVAEAAAVEPPPHQIIRHSGQRELEATIEVMANLADLVTQLNMRAERTVAARKFLVFCNARNEVEETAAFLRRYLNFEAAVYVHYSNLDGGLRREVEAQFAAAAVAVCVCTSTLELGIDIGSIDDVILIGAPPSLSSFLQRIGRGGRRTGVSRVLCMARSPLEEIRFRALIELARDNQLALTPPSYVFRPSVLVQQIFSILKQSPTGAIRLADLRRIVPIPYADEKLREIFGNLVWLHYLKTGRVGEWRPGPQLDELLDAHEIYSNIGSDPLSYQIVDAFTGRTIATTTRLGVEGDRLLIGGRSLEVVWRDRNRLGVRYQESGEVTAEIRFDTTPFALSLEVSQGIARWLGLRPGEMVLTSDEGQVLLFHFWGAAYGELLAAVLRSQLYPTSGQQVAPDYDARNEVFWPVPGNEVYLRLPEVLLQLPPLNLRTTYQSLRQLVPRLEPFLNLGRFHALLPPGLAHENVLEICDVPRFKNLYESVSIVAPSAALKAQLRKLL